MPEPREPEILDESLWRFVTQLQKDEFYGVAELHFHEGRVVRVKKQEVFLPKDLNRLAAV